MAAVGRYAPNPEPPEAWVRSPIAYITKAPSSRTISPASTDPEPDQAPPEIPVTYWATVCIFELNTADRYVVAAAA